MKSKERELPPSSEGSKSGFGGGTKCAIQCTWSKALLAMRGQAIGQSWAERYLQVALGGEKRAAIKLANLLLERGVPVIDMYANVFTAAMERVGELWRAGKISIADERLASEITMAVMEKMRSAVKLPRHFSARIVILCIEGEQHYIGARMIADLFQIEGWNVDFMGPDVPTSALSSMILHRRPQLLGLSVTLPQNKRRIGDVIDEIARLEFRPSLLLGGQSVSANDYWQSGELTIRVAANALDGLYIARQLIRPDHSHAVLEDYLEKLGLAVRRLRNDVGWTQQRLATATGLTRAYLVAVEGGKQNVTVDVVIRLANALGVPPDHLFATQTDVT